MKRTLFCTPVIRNHTLVTMKFLQLLLLALAAVHLATAAETHIKLTETEGINIGASKIGGDFTPLLSKLPLALPMLSSRLETQECKDVGKSLGVHVAGLSAAKPDMEEVKRIVCMLGEKCAREFVAAIKGLVKQTPMVEALVKKQLGEGMDYDFLEIAAMGYYAENCPEEPSDEL